MAIKVGINGFGRIGRLVLRAGINNPDIEFVGVNDITDAKTLAYLLKYDSNHGAFDGTVEAKDGALAINGKDIGVCSERDPANLPWKDLGADVVVESTGLFRDQASAGKHLKAGAKKVIISAPAKDPDLTIVMGVNNDAYDAAKHHIVSNASCTTNCLAPVVKVLKDKYGIKRGLMTTIHSYTNDQQILDLPHKDLRRARAAALSMIPTTTGAAKAVGLVFPDLKGKLDGYAMRVPTPNVSVVDLSVELEKEVEASDINAAMKAASEGELKGILGYNDESLVSKDFNGNSNSSIFDAPFTNVLGGQSNFAKVLSWYDNEWAFSVRVIDLIKHMASKGL
jgi:glyceraldehyde 3-phosphate dehydrogenase